MRLLRYNITINTLSASENKTLGYPAGSQRAHKKGPPYQGQQQLLTHGVSISPYLVSSWSLNLDLNLGWGKRGKSGRNAAFAAELTVISPSTSDFKSLNTDHAAHQGAGGMGGARHTHAREAEKGVGQPPYPPEMSMTSFFSHTLIHRCRL